MCAAGLSRAEAHDQRLSQRRKGTCVACDRRRACGRCAVCGMAHVQRVRKAVEHVRRVGAAACVR